MEMTFRNLLTICITTVMLMVVFGSCVSGCNNINAKLSAYCLSTGKTPAECKELLTK